MHPKDQVQQKRTTNMDASFIKEFQEPQHWYNLGHIKAEGKWKPKKDGSVILESTPQKPGY